MKQGTLSQMRSNVCMKDQKSLAVAARIYTIWLNKKGNALKTWKLNTLHKNLTMLSTYSWYCSRTLQQLHSCLSVTWKFHSNPEAVTFTVHMVRKLWICSLQHLINTSQIFTVKWCQCLSSTNIHLNSLSSNLMEWFRWAQYKLPLSKMHISVMLTSPGKSCISICIDKQF